MIPSLTTIRTPDGILRPLGLIPSKLYGAGILPAAPPETLAPLIPRDQLEEYESWPAELAVLDQQQWNACTYFASAQALMYARHENGQPHVALDPLVPYLITTGGRNTGTNILQAGKMLSDYGMPPVGSSRKSDVAKQAGRFRIELAESITTYDQLLSEVARRHAVVGSTCVQNRWNQLDAEGAMGVDRGYSNHAIFLGGGLKKSARHGWMVKHCCSWSAQWGDNGFGWYTEAHFDNAGYGEAYTVETVHEDLADTDNPPEVIA